MNKFLKTVIILFCLYISGFTIIDLLFEHGIKWEFNLILALIFSILFAPLFINKN